MAFSPNILTYLCYLFSTHSYENDNCNNDFVFVTMLSINRRLLLSISDAAAMQKHASIDNGKMFVTCVVNLHTKVICMLLFLDKTYCTSPGDISFDDIHQWDSWDKLLMNLLNLLDICNTYVRIILHINYYIIFTGITNWKFVAYYIRWID